MPDDYWWRFIYDNIIIYKHKQLSPLISKARGPLLVKHTYAMANERMKAQDFGTGPLGHEPVVCVECDGNDGLS